MDGPLDLLLCSSALLRYLGLEVETGDRGGGQGCLGKQLLHPGIEHRVDAGGREFALNEASQLFT